MAAPVAVLSILVTANTKAAEASLLRVNEKMAATQTRAGKAGAALGAFSKAAVGAGAVIGIAAVKQASDFEQALLLVHTQAGATKKEVDSLRGSVLKLAKDSEFSPKQLADGLFRVESAGFRGKKALDLLHKSVELAEVGQSDLEQTTKALTGAMRSGIPGTETAAKTIGTLNAAVGQGSLRMEDLVGALSTGFLPSARAFGLSLKDVTSALDVMTAAGVPAQAAATRLRMTFSLIGAPTKKAQDALKEIGLSATDMAEEMRKPAGLIKALELVQDHLDGLTKVQQAQVVSRIFGGGRSSAAVLLLLQNMDRLRKVYDATGEAAKHFGEAAEAQAETPAEKFHKAWNRINVLLVQLGSKIAPAAANAMEKLTGIISDPKLSVAEKLTRIVDLMIKSFSDAAPKLAEAGAKAAGALGKGFVEAWNDMNVIGKLFTATALIRIVGGKGAIVATGAAIGRLFGIGVGTGAASAAGAGAAAGGGGAAAGGAAGGLAGFLGKFGKFGKIAKIGGISAGIILADATISEFGRRAAERGDDMWKALKAAKGGPFAGDILSVGGLFRKESEKAARDLEPILKAIAEGSKSISAGRAQELREEIEKLKDVSPATRKGLMDVVNASRNATDAVAINIRKMRMGTGTDLKGMADLAKQNMRAIRDGMGTNSEEGRKLVDKSFKAMAGSIASNIKRGRISADDGLKALKQQARIHSDGTRRSVRDNFVKAREAIESTIGRSITSSDKGFQTIRGLVEAQLKLYGLNPKKALGDLSKVPKLKQDLFGNFGSGGTGGPTRRQQKGGVVPGFGSGDKVPLAVAGRTMAMVEPGEGVYVVNRDAMKAAAALNGAFPRKMQSGGIVALGRELQREGYLVGENPAFGGVLPVHAKNSYHYSGQAIDVNWPNAAEEAGKLDALYNRLKNMPGVVELLWRVAGHFDHLHVALAGGAAGALGPMLAQIGKVSVGGQGPVKDIVNAALNVVRGGANQALSQLSGMEGGEAGIQTGGDFSKQQLMRLWVRAGGNPGMANLMAAIALAESGGNSQIVNSIGATGLWQIHPGGSQYLDPLTNAKTAVYKLATQGLGAWEAYTNGNYRQFLKKGGPLAMLAMLQGGGAASNPYGPLRGSDLFSQSPFAAPFSPYKTSISGDLGRLLATERRKGIKPRIRRRELHRFIKRVKGLGLGDAMEKRLKKLTDDAEIYGDYADRASQLTETADDGTVTPGIVRGKTEAQWLTDQLSTLWKLRNKLLAAMEVIAKKREVVAKLFTRSQKRYGVLNEQIGAAGRRKRGLEGQLKTLQKHPKKNKDAIKALKKTIAGIDSAQTTRVRERNALKDRILPALKGQRSALGTSRSDLLESLTSVQGVGSPMEIMDKMVSPIDTRFGGQLFDVQLRLRDLNAPAAATDTDTGETADLLRELLRQSNLRYAVSQAQYAVLQNMPFAGSFGGGGVVPGPIGMPMAAVVHGGEVIGSPVAPVIQVNIAPGMEWLKQFITVTVGDVTRQQAKPARSPLPGRGGGLQRNV